MWIFVIGVFVALLWEPMTDVVDFDKKGKANNGRRNQ
jgi:hypothetical protein